MLLKGAVRDSWEKVAIENADNYVDPTVKQENMRMLKRLRTKRVKRGIAIIGDLRSVDHTGKKKSLVTKPRFFPKEP